ncbi:hypothetical protein NC653_018251 [Populus alba x Populus x berolinensis]|uniref:Uncharacterized protein n=1 Tax=Populus alba x Populus x berolinensis TaxID=444605 RepID=A0AAD6VUP9_9ROSI|nr:hypothetical protein NC653_018251 [Populus alba x Populus x berolinensis]
MNNAEHKEARLQKKQLEHTQKWMKRPYKSNQQQSSQSRMMRRQQQSSPATVTPTDQQNGWKMKGYL